MSFSKNYAPQNSTHPQTAPVKIASTMRESSNARLSLSKGQRPLSKALSQQSKIGMSTASLIPGHQVTSATYRSAKGGFKIPRYQNSYRLHAHNPWKQEVVDKVLEDVMTTTLTGMKYNPEVCMKLCQDMTAEIRNRIYRKDYDRRDIATIACKEIFIHERVKKKWHARKLFTSSRFRYKFIVQVTIVEKTGQSLQVANGRLWDIERDNHSSFTFESSQMYAVGIVVGVYYE
ncbi:dynein light chain Tctex-type protein 2-like [Neodiprion lecontei]|uniref:Dynein light chain Tctex-type protein 2-like n=1 Tax=Neodiprion lecontei TaxID=441921 RepID=A0ABM3GM01_NEOLC|nr:dynein light chain Tctex-type protein 2-like [Neodiprion lecontei]